MTIEKLGKYAVEGELGRGGMGVVYKSTDPDNGAHVAVKVLPAQLADDPVFVNRFRREMMTLQRLEHSGVVRILDQGEQDGAYYYVMEYMDGGSLENNLKSAPLDPLAATRIVLAVSRVLEHLHAQGVIHRDLKPANILLSKDGQSKLTDFGIAKLVDATRMTATQSMLGTVEYMSPEQSQGRFVDPRTDIYSLGVIYYRALTGRMPVTGKTATEVIMNLRTRQIERPDAWRPELPQYLSDLVMQMLDKDAAKRVPSAKALTRELERVEQRLIQEADHKTGGGFDQSDAVARWPVPAASNSLLRNPWAIGVLLLIFGIIAGGFWLSLRPPSAATRMKTAREYLELKTPGGKKLAEMELDALLVEHPKSPESIEAQKMLLELKKPPEIVEHLWTGAQLAETNGDVDLAKEIYKLITTHFPKTNQGARAAGRIAELEHRTAFPSENPSPVPDNTKTTPSVAGSESKDSATKSEIPNPKLEIQSPHEKENQ